MDQENRLSDPTTGDPFPGWEHYDERVVKRLVQDRMIWTKALGTGTGGLDPLIAEVMPEGPLRDRALFELSSQRLDESVGDWYLRVSGLYEKIHRQEGMAITELDLTLQFVVGLTSGLTRARIWALRPEKMSDLIEYVAGQHTIRSHVMAPAHRQEFLEQSRSEVAEQQGHLAVNLPRTRASGSAPPPRTNHRYTWVKPGTPTAGRGRGASLESSSLGGASSSPGTDGLRPSGAATPRTSDQQGRRQPQDPITETLQADLAKATEDNQKLRRTLKKLSGRIKEMERAKVIPPELEDLRTKLEQCSTVGAGVIAEHLQRFAGAETHHRELYDQIDRLQEELSQKTERPGARLEALERENQLLRRTLRTERQEQLLARERLVSSQPIPLTDLEAKGKALFSVRHSLTEALLGMRRLQDTHFREVDQATQRQSPDAGDRPSCTTDDETSGTSPTEAPRPTTLPGGTRASRDPSLSRSHVSAGADAGPTSRPPSPWLPRSRSRSCEPAPARDSGTPPLRIASPTGPELTDPEKTSTSEDPATPPLPGGSPRVGADSGLESADGPEEASMSAGSEDSEEEGSPAGIAAKRMKLARQAEGQTIYQWMRQVINADEGDSTAGFGNCDREAIAAFTSGLRDPALRRAMAEDGLDDLGQACLYAYGLTHQSPIAAVRMFLHELPEGEVKDRMLATTINSLTDAWDEMYRLRLESDGTESSRQRHAFSTVNTVAFMSAKQEPDESIADWEKRALSLYLDCHPKVGAALASTARDLLDRFILGLYEDKVREDTWAWIWPDRLITIGAASDFARRRAIEPDS